MNNWRQNFSFTKIQSHELAFVIFLSLFTGLAIILGASNESGNQSEQPQEQKVSYFKLPQ